MKKYNDVWLNNQHILTAERIIECPFCTFWCKKYTWKDENNEAPQHFLCNNKACGFWLQLSYYNGIINFTLCKVTDYEDQYYFFYVYNEGEMACDRITKHQSIIDLSNFPKFMEELEILEFYS